MKTAQIIAIKPTKSPNKIQLEIQDTMERPNTSLLGLFNANDSRFSGTGRILSWMTAEVENAKQLLPQLSKTIDACIASGETQLLEINFMLENKPVRLQVTETHSIRESDMEYLSRKAKKIPGTEGKPDRYLLKNGMFIFRNVQAVNPKVEVVDGHAIYTVDHKLINHDSETTELAYGHFICKDVIYNGNLEAISTITGEVIEGSIV